MLDIEIIAEIGINHQGSPDIARRLIEEAARCGVKGIKFQYRNLDNAYADADREIGDEILIREISKNYIDPCRLLELGDHARRLGLKVGTSFFAVGDLADFGDALATFDFFKVPSAELMNAPLVDALLAIGRHVYLSTGCHTEAEVVEALGRLPAQGWTPMHCISNYPTTLQNARLGQITHLIDRWRRPAGFSSHDERWEVCLLAMREGASVIERHITFDKRAQGLDHTSSSTPDEFALLGAFAKNLSLILAGNGDRVPNQGERLNRQNLGRSFFARRALPEGHAVSAEDLVYRSPGIGLGHAEISGFLGRPLAAAVPKGAPITTALFDRPLPISVPIIEAARRMRLSLPVRLHDLALFERLFPIGAYEFHLSFAEIRSRVDTGSMSRDHAYSIHLPDYVSSTELMDPFAADEGQRAASEDIIERTVRLAESLQGRTGREVPVVGSFSVVHGSLERFYGDHATLLHGIAKRGVQIVPQWLPPVAWYFGGSVRLEAMNSPRDVEFIRRHRLPICLDICHVLMGRNLLGFDVDPLLDDLGPWVRHVHLADAAGVDGEGLDIGEGDPANMAAIHRALAFDCLKVVEVWQGHLDQGSGFRRALTALAEVSFAHV